MKNKKFKYYDSNFLDDMLTEKENGQELYADNAYVGQEETPEKNDAGLSI